MLNVRVGDIVRESNMHEPAEAKRRDRLIQLANLLAAHERATPLARRVLECRVSLLEAQLNATPEDEPEAAAS